MSEIDQEDLDLEIYDAWAKEKEDDTFKDTYEWLLSWDYFKAGYMAALAKQAKEGSRDVLGNPQKAL
jgi:hypothetical protein